MADYPTPIDVNALRVVGHLQKEPYYNEVGADAKPCANFTIIIPRASRTGKQFNSYVRCTAWGDQAKAMQGRKEGEEVRIIGKLYHEVEEEFLYCGSKVEVTSVIFTQDEPF